MGNGDETMNTMENGWKRCMWIYLEKWMFNLRWFNHPELWRWYLEYNLSYHFYPLVNWHQSVHRSSSSQLGIPRIGTSTMPKLMKNERWFRVSCSTCSKQTAFSLLKTMGMHRYHSLSGLVLHHLGSSHVLDWSQNVWSFWVKLSLDLFSNDSLTVAIKFEGYFWCLHHTLITKSCAFQVIYIYIYTMYIYIHIYIYIYYIYIYI